jgi:colicin import membrane protein
LGKTNSRHSAETQSVPDGGHDLAIAAPSMKAALEAWGGSNLFHQGFARESEDPDVVAATTAAPGIVLRRAVGSDGPFREHADLPSNLVDIQHEKRTTTSRKLAPRPPDEKATRKAALLFEKQERHRETLRRKEAAAEERRRQRRDEAIAKAQAALDRGKREHDKAMGAIEDQRKVLDQRSEREAARWEREKGKLEEILRNARE